MNGDELVDVDFTALLDAASRERGGGDGHRGPAAVAVRAGRSHGRRRRDRLPRGVARARTGSTAASTSSSPAAIERFPEKGDHETTIFPELAAEGSLARHTATTGLWLTVNTPKELRRADEHVTPTSRVALVTTPYSFAPRHVDKPWGYELIWAESETTSARCCSSAPGRRSACSTTSRRTSPGSSRAGRASLELGQVGGELETFEIATGDCFRYRPGTVHRVTAIEDTTILEVSTPHLDDVVRLDDRYGRPERDA